MVVGLRAAAPASKPTQVSRAVLSVEAGISM